MWDTHVLNSLVICQMAVATFTYQIDTLLHRVCPHAYIFSLIVDSTAHGYNDTYAILLDQ